MLVRCGRCRVELEVTAPGEFLCPSCGSRNVVRGTPSPVAPSPLDLGHLSSIPTPTPQPPSAPSDVRWVRCPVCAYRFALGDVEEVACPSCAQQLKVEGETVKTV